MEAIIYGAGEIGNEALRILMVENSVDVVGFLDDDRTVAQGSAGRFRIIGDSRDLGRFRRFGVEGICIACEDGSKRTRLAEMAEKEGYHILTVKSGKCSVSPDAHIGRGCIILDYSRINSGATIAHCCIIGRGVEIERSAIIPAGSSLFRNQIIKPEAGSETVIHDPFHYTHFTRGGAVSK